jgi:peptide chain release factor 1
MLDKLQQVENRYQELEGLLIDPAVLGNRKEFAKLAKERSTLEQIVARYRDWKKLSAEIDGHKLLLEETDPELREIAKAELPGMRERLQALEDELKRLLLPRDPNDDRNVIFEIRAGTGGEEASLFAAQLFRMYCRYAETRGWRVEMMSVNATGLGGYKEVIALVEGNAAYSRLKFEGGVHRVQRVPETEAQGRVHTSTATVAVLPEAEDVDVQIREEDLQISIAASGGPGGQGVNTTNSAVQVLHKPTGIIVKCQDERSQIKNKSRAHKVLRARLLEREQRAQQEAEALERRGMVGSGERAEKIRTYNYPQNRVTDHRIGLTLHKLDAIIDGDLFELITALKNDHQAAMLAAQSRR